MLMEQYMKYISVANMMVLTKAIGAGSLGGVVAGLVAQYWYAGKLTIVAYVVIASLTLAPMKGWGRIAALLAFGLTAGATTVIVKSWGDSWWRLFS